MRIDWKCFTVVLIIVLTVVAIVAPALAARGGERVVGGPQGVRGISGEKPASSLGSLGVAGGAQRIGGNVQPGGGAPVGQGGQFTGGTGQAGQFAGRTFDRNSFFQGHNVNWWRQNREHRYWNGNAWVFGVEPVGFVAVPVPVSSCPYSPGMFGGDPNACFFSCVDNGYDPVSVCDICCGTNY